MRYYIDKLTNKLYSYLGKESTSLILYMDLRDVSVPHKEEGFKYHDNANVIKKMISGLPSENMRFKKWIKNGGILCTSDHEVSNGLPRVWLHFKGDRTVSNFNISLQDRTGWLGPAFVPFEFRGQKLHYRLMGQHILKAKDSGKIDHLFTTTSIYNTTAMKNILKYDFQIVGLLKSRRFLFYTHKQKLAYSNIMNEQLKIK